MDVTTLLDQRHSTVCRGARPAGLGFGPFFLIFGILVPATITHPKLVALVRNKQNMYGT